MCLVLDEEGSQSHTALHPMSVLMQHPEELERRVANVPNPFQKQITLRAAFSFASYTK